MLRTSISLLLGLTKAAYDSSEIVLMKDYPADYRTLNCWECFQAQGKMCHDKDHSSMLQVTGSSNRGHGVCCKPGFTGQHCNDDGAHVCSQPASAQDTSAPYNNILTNGFNHQLFAYCPRTNAKTCGISSSTTGAEGSMVLAASNKTQTISLIGDQQIRYNDGPPSVRRFDSCFYEIAGSQAEGEQDNMRIYLQVTKSSQMNIYLYGGKSRSDSTMSLIGDNEQVTVGKEYTIEVKKGMLLVAYPNKDQETEFEFNYWVAPYDKTVLDKMIELDFDGPMGQQAKAMLVAAAAGLAVIFCVCVCCCVKKCKKAKAKNQVVVLAEETDLPQLDSAKAVGPSNKVVKASKDDMTSIDMEEGSGAVHPKMQEQYNSQTELNPGNKQTYVRQKENLTAPRTKFAPNPLNK